MTTDTRVRRIENLIKPKETDLLNRLLKDDTKLAEAILDDKPDSIIAEFDALDETEKQRIIRKVKQIKGKLPFWLYLYTDEGKYLTVIEEQRKEYGL